MYSSRTRVKNVLLGQRVCAPWKDGLYYAGVIEAVKSRPTGESTFTILFDDGYIAEIDEDDIVGPSFAKVSSVQLHSGQRVYITYHGRDMPARVVKHKPSWKKVVVRVLDHGEHLLTVKQEELRLLKGQKPPVDGQLLNNLPCKECPVPCKIKAQSVDFEQCPSKHQENLTRSEEMAALVLTSLSISPVVKDQENLFKEELIFSPSPDSGTEMAHVGSPQSYSLSNSPTASTSPSSLEEFKYPQRYSPSSHYDEGIGIEFVKKERTRKRKNSTSSTGSKKVVYLCTWPGCGKTLSTVPGIIRHVRTIHLGPKRHSEDGYSDGEEEFYFTEKDDDQEDFCDPFPHPLALSPTPTQSHFDMVKSPWSEPCISPEIMEATENSPQNLRFNWDFHIADQATANKAASTTRSTQPSHHRKIRGESKKCRKVYGMDNRHLWCTQCRWKKACVRFSDS